MAIWDWVTTAADNDDADSNINWLEGQAPSTVNDSARSMMARISHWLNNLSGNVTMGGTGNAYTLTTGESLAAYPSNFRILWQPNADSTGAVTLNVDSIGAKKVFMPDGSQAASGDLDADSMYDVAYDSALDSAAGGFKIIGFPDAVTSGALIASNNLSDVASASTARSNLGLGTAAVQADTYFAQVANNLSDLASASTARTNLGLGDMATASYSDTQTFTGIVSVNTSGSNASFGGADELSLRNTAGDVGMTFWSAATGRALVCFADPTGGNVNNRLEVYSDAHASQANNWVFISDGAEFMRWDKSSSQVEITGGLTVSANLDVDGIAYLDNIRGPDSGYTIGGDTDNLGAALQLFPTSGQIRGYIDGSESFRFNSTGLGIGTDSPDATLDVNGDIIGRIANSSLTTGTITAAWLNKTVFATGTITLAASIATTSDMIGPIVGNGASRTINRGTMTNMFVNGTNVSSCTLDARGGCTILFSSSTTCYVFGDVS